MARKKKIKPLIEEPISFDDLDTDLFLTVLKAKADKILFKQLPRMKELTREQKLAIKAKVMEHRASKIRLRAWLKRVA